MSEPESMCDACGKSLKGWAYASIGGNFVPYIPAKLYHFSCVPPIKFEAKTQCPQCRGKVTSSGGHGQWCLNSCCKWGWETEMDGSPLKPSTQEKK